MGGGAKGGPDLTPIDAELAKAGAFGKYQCFLILNIVMGIFSANVITHGIGILEMAPVAPGFLCTNTESGETYICDNTEVCSDDVTFEVDEDANI